MKRVKGIELYKHQIPRFRGVYSYPTDHSANPARPNSPNALPFSNVMWCVEFFGSLNFGASQATRGEQWD